MAKSQLQQSKQRSLGVFAPVPLSESQSGGTLTWGQSDNLWRGETSFEADLGPKDEDTRSGKNFDG